jgi:hypothetical protein
MLRRAETARAREHVGAPPAGNVDAYVHENRLSPLHREGAVLQTVRLSNILPLRPRRRH